MVEQLTVNQLVIGSSPIWGAMWKDKRDRQEYFNSRRQKVMDFLRNYKSDKKCTKCGYKEHPEILQFHHRDPSEKEFKMGKGSVGNYSREKLMKEIEKCDLLCPNCHLWHHYQETAK